MLHWPQMGKRLQAVLVAIWQFIGRVGLAIRRLGVLFIWRPILFVTAPFRFVARHTWPILGGMGVALRTLLTYLVWWPLALLFYPFGLLFKHILLPVLKWFGSILLRLFAWLARAMETAVTHPIRRRWAATEPQRLLRRRHHHSRWLVRKARLRVFFRRPRPPKTAVTAPHIPLPPNVRRLRFITALISAIAITLVGFFTFQERGQNVSADNRVLSRILIATPSPEPETAVTITPSPTPQPTPWPTPDPLTEGGSLAFTLHINGNSDIYLLPVGRAEPLRLTSNPAADREPAWSPDGREIAFSSHRSGDWEIYVYNLPFGKLSRVTNSPGLDGSPHWSPDGQWLVYESYRNENMDIYIVKADGSEGPFRLTENVALDYAPAWAPDGRHVAFVSWRSGNPDLFMLSLDQVSDET
ncbi:MAG: TolB family protein, partial [Anaerolineales bacterium]|nr:TolB family protein [Anaerolineales bacterium]